MKIRNRSFSPQNESHIAKPYRKSTFLSKMTSRTNASQKESRPYLSLMKITPDSPVIELFS